MPAILKTGTIDNYLPSEEDVYIISRYIRQFVDRFPEFFTAKTVGDFIRIFERMERPPKVDYIKNKNIGWGLDKWLNVHEIYRDWNYFINQEEILGKVKGARALSENEPVKLGFLGMNNVWIFKGYRYITKGPYTDEEFRLLILHDFDKERKKFESLKRKFQGDKTGDSAQSRTRIPEQVRIDVWRRDGGKCARCGSRENLEYDHIVPVSKGGSNTTRNIELLCEKCNRQKGANIE